jgi:hydroxymethylpyrimidine pyrophosphatase-like HAD family hydrolase
MQPLSSAPPNEFADVDYILTDLDDTITLDGRLPAASYAALEALEKAGKHVIIVTGRPAGWCDLLARFFPVSAVVGENGAFYFRYDRQTRIMHRAFQRTDAEREQDRARLDTIYAGILARYPNLRLSADQPYRVSDLAVDFCEDVEDFSKLEMSLRLLQDVYSVTPADTLDRVVYVGDSPNDEPMFGHFRHTVGVANLSPFLAHLRKRPAWITARPGGLGFAELASRLLKI